MKKLLVLIIAFISLSLNAQRTLSSNTRVVNLDTIPQTYAITVDPQGHLAMTELPDGGSGGANNLARYNSEADFPATGSESIIYYARTEDQFYLWENDTQLYRNVPVSVKSVTAGNYLQNNGTAKDPVLDVQTSQFVQSVDAGPVRNSAINNTLNNISLTGQITKSPVTYRTYDGNDIQAAGGTVEDLLASITYDTDFIAISAPGITYLLKENSIDVNKVLDSQGNIVNFTFYLNDSPNNIFTRRYGFFNINSTPKALTNLDANYTAYSYNGLDNGTGNVFLHTSNTTDQYTVMYSVVSAVSGAAAETVTTLVDNGNSFTYTSENGTITNIDLPSGSGGSNNLNEVIVTNSSQLSNPVNAGKRLILQNDIDLANGDYTFADDIELVSYGGKLVNYNSIDINGAKFNADRIDRIIIDDSGTLTGKTKSKEIYCKWFGLTDTEEVNQYDNRAVLKNVARITAYTGATVWVNPGHFYFNVVENQRFAQPERPNITIYGEVHWKGFGWQQTKLEVLPNDSLGRSVAFVTDHAENGSFEGIWLKGDLETTGDQQNEFRSGLTITNESHGFKVLNNRLSHFTGDGLNHYSWDDFNNNFFTYEQGGIDDSGIDEVNANRWRSALANISPQALDAGYGMVTGGSFGSYDTLSDFAIQVFFYDENDQFIDKTEYVFTYKTIPLPPGARKIRTEINTPIGNIAPTSIQFRAELISKRVLVKGNIIDHNFRNGISNPAQEWLITYNYIWRNGGRFGGPGYGCGPEDGYQGLSDFIISYNTFESNFNGAITIRWNRNIRIIGNTFLGKTDPLLTGKSNINARESWDLLLQGNYYYSTDISLGRYAKIVGGTAYDSNITMANVGTKVDGLTSYNGGVKPAGDGVNTPGRSLVTNSDFIITRKLENTLFGNNISFDEVQIKVQNGITFGTIGLFDNFQFTTTNEYRDFAKDFSITGADGESFGRGISIVPIDIKDADFSTSLHFTGGQRVDVELKNNQYREGIRFEDFNSSYTNDGSDFKTITIDGGYLSSFEGETSSASLGAAIGTADRDLNLIVKNITIDLKDHTNGYFLGLLHNGFTIFENVTFTADTTLDLDLNRLVFGSNAIDCSSIIFRNCDFDDVNFTPRTIDVVQQNGGGNTNLSYTASPTNGIVNSDTGTNAEIIAANSTNAGLLLPSDYDRVQVIETVLEAAQRNGWTGTEAELWALLLAQPDQDNDGNPDSTDPNPSVATANNDSFVDFPENRATTGDIIANDDFIPSSDITITNLGTGNAVGTVSFNNLTGEFTYTPTSGEVGNTVTIDYRVTYVPTGVSADATISIGVIVDNTDPDAEAYFAANGITNTTTRNAITTFIKGMKTDGNWAGKEAVYFFVGGSENAVKFNAKNPQDTDAAHRLTFSGTWTHDATGSDPDGSTAFANTHLVAGDLTDYNTSVSMYVNEQNTTNAIDIGASLFGPRLVLSAQTGSAAKVEMYGFSSPDGTTATETNTVGFYTGSRVSSSDLRLYKDGVEIANDLGTTTTSLPNSDIYLSALNVNNSSQNSFSPRKLLYVSIGIGQTPTQVANENTRIQQLKTDLGL